jgi:hypothetical protein
VGITEQETDERKPRKRRKNNLLRRILMQMGGLNGAVYPGL